MDNAAFSKILRNLLDSRGVSQKWLAEEAETTEATISRYVSGKTQPEITIVVKIPSALRVSMDYLCGLTNMPTPKESLDTDLQLLLHCYEKADPRDRKIIWTILERHMGGSDP